VAEVARTHGLGFPVVLDADTRVTRVYGVSTFPTTFVVSAEGKILASMVGCDGTDWSSPGHLALFDRLLGP
jgi:peroxiredoxin